MSTSTSSTLSATLILILPSCDVTRLGPVAVRAVVDPSVYTSMSARVICSCFVAHADRNTDAAAKITTAARALKHFVTDPACGRDLRLKMLIRKALQKFAFLYAAWYSGVYMNQLNKIILKTAIEGLVWTAIGFSFGLGVFAMSFPGEMAKFYDTVGNRYLSSMYYGRVYDRDQTEGNLYYALSKAILAENDKNTIKYGAEFFKEGVDRTAFTTAIDNKLFASSSPFKDDFREIYTTDGWLRDGYIRALTRRGAAGDLDEINRVKRS